jgi:hypothetical protein
MFKATTEPSGFREIYLELTRLRASVEDLRKFNAKCRNYLKTAAEPSAPSDRERRPLNKLIRCAKVGCTARESSALAVSYIRFKLIEALQPHPAYEKDDGFQQLSVILSLKFEGDRKAKKALAELRRSGQSLSAVVNDLVSEGIAVKTGYEPWNGDVMIGLTQNLSRRPAAHCERKNVIVESARKFGLRPRWNADGTGSLETASGEVVSDGNVWTLLSHLYQIIESIANRHRTLN